MLFGKVDTLFLERIDESVLPFCISHDFMVDIFGVFQIPAFRTFRWVAAGMPIDENTAILCIQHMMLHVVSSPQP